MGDDAWERSNELETPEAIRRRIDFEKDGLRRAERILEERRLDLTGCEAGGLGALIHGLLGTRAARIESARRAVADAEALVEERRGIVAELEGRLSGEEETRAEAARREDERKGRLLVCLEQALASDHPDVERLGLLVELEEERKESVTQLRGADETAEGMVRALRSAQEGFSFGMGIIRESLLRRGLRHRTTLGAVSRLPANVFSTVEEGLDAARRAWSDVERVLRAEGLVGVDGLLGPERDPDGGRDGGDLEAATSGGHPSVDQEPELDREEVFDRLCRSFSLVLCRLAPPTPAQFTGLGLELPDEIRRFESELDGLVMQAALVLEKLRIARQAAEEEHDEASRGLNELSERILAGASETHS